MAIFIVLEYAFSRRRAAEMVDVRSPTEQHERIAALIPAQRFGSQYWYADTGSQFRS